MKKGQALIGFILLAAIGIFAKLKYVDNTKLVLFLVTGLMLGYVFQRSRFGFAGGVKKIALTGDGSLTKGLLLLFALAVIGIGGIHFAAAQGGAEAAFRAAEGVAVIPGTGFVTKITLGFMVGAFLFGFGMILGGGCASGTLTDLGEGSVRALIVLFFFCIGSVLATAVMPSLKNTFLYSSGSQVYLPDYFGYFGAIVISLLLLTVIYAVVKFYENKRKNAGTFEALQYEEWEKPMAESKNYSFFSKETYHKFFVERWSFLTGAAIIAVILVFVLSTTGSSWGVSGPYTTWGVALFSKLGFNFSNEAFAGAVKAVQGGIFNDPVSVRNISMILGAAICMLLAGQWKFSIDFKGKDIIFFGIAGITMGFGAKMASGCNAGGLFSGIANLSLAGWVYLVFMALGGVVGVYVFKNFMSQGNVKVDKKAGKKVVAR